MNQDHDLPSSDSEDEDYVPADASDVSEEDSDNAIDEEGSPQKKGKTDGSASSKKGKKRKQKNSEAAARKRKGGIKLDDEQQEEENNIGESVIEPANEEVDTKVLEEQEKKRVDNLWADFLKDVPIKPRSSVGSSAAATPQKVVSTPPSSSVKPSSSTTAKMVSVTKVFDFAGEEVRVTETVDAESKEGKKALAQQSGIGTPLQTPARNGAGTPLQQNTATPGQRRQSGIGSLIGNLSGKKAKMSTLDKSNLDWKSFKQEEGIDEELQAHNKGKAGFLERQAFLNRTDLRQFEIERSLREIRRNK